MVVMGTENVWRTICVIVKEIGKEMTVLIVCII